MRDKLIELLFEIIAVKPAETLNDMAEYLIANGVTIQQWIPVSERLPEEREGWGFLYSDTVLVSYKRHDGSICITTCSTTDGEWNAVPKITHWMPLPEPPREEV